MHARPVACLAMLTRCEVKTRACLGSHRPQGSQPVLGPRVRVIVELGGSGHVRTVWPTTGTDRSGPPFYQSPRLRSRSFRLVLPIRSWAVTSHLGSTTTVNGDRNRSHATNSPYWIAKKPFVVCWPTIQYNDVVGELAC
jgi:hypothetical protein